MNNIVTFSSGSVDLNAQPVHSLPEGMSEERARELLQGSPLGRDVLFYGTSEGVRQSWITRKLGEAKDVARAGYHAIKEGAVGAAKGVGGGALLGTLATAPTGIGAAPGAVVGGLAGALVGGAMGVQGGLEEHRSRKHQENYHAGKLAEHAQGLQKAIQEHDVAVNQKGFGKVYGPRDQRAVDDRVNAAAAKIQHHKVKIDEHTESLSHAKEFFSDTMTATEMLMNHHDAEFGGPGSGRYPKGSGGQTSSAYDRGTQNKEAADRHFQAASKLSIEAKQTSDPQKRAKLLKESIEHREAGVKNLETYEKKSGQEYSPSKPGKPASSLYKMISRSRRRRTLRTLND